MTTEQHIDEFKQRRLKLEELRKTTKNPFKYTYDQTHHVADILAKYSSIEGEETSSEIVSIAGRLIAKRGHGKASFANLLDGSGAMQLYFKQDILGEEQMEMVHKLDIGDILGIKGPVFRTHKGELSIRVEEFSLLTKSLNPLPEKFHGLQDKELRYRQRYVDLIANPEVRETFKNRSKIIRLIRNYLDSKNFMEVETPVLQPIYGGAAAKPFITHHNALDMDLYLRIALELHLKRLIVGGFERVYEISRVFRNEGVSYKHNPEYTLLELYQAYVDYHEMMKVAEDIVSTSIKEINGSYKINYQGTDLDFTPPFDRITMHEVIKKYAKIDINKPLKEIIPAAKNLGLEFDDLVITKGQLINLIYDKSVEHHLVRPTFVYDYQLETSPLAKPHRDNPELVERFELIVNGMEIANAFSELNDPIDQRARLEEQVAQREAGDEEANMMDEDFVTSLEYGMPPTGGLGIGIDRVVMLATNSASIRDVILFPHMRTKE